LLAASTDCLFVLCISELSVCLSSCLSLFLASVFVTNQRVYINIIDVLTSELKHWDIQWETCSLWLANLDSRYSQLFFPDLSIYVCMFVCRFSPLQVAGQPP